MVAVVYELMQYLDPEINALVIYTDDSRIGKFGTPVIDEDMVLVLETENEVAGIEGIVVNGMLALPTYMSVEDLRALNLSGDGFVIIGECRYTPEGAELPQFIGGELDFTNVGTEEGQTPAVGNGYVWDAATKTLTLTDACINSGIIFPKDSITVVLNGKNHCGAILRTKDYELPSLRFTGTGALRIADGFSVSRTASIHRIIKLFGSLRRG